MKRMVQAAESAGLPDSHDWLCYREPPNYYWILSFSDGPTDFACPPTLAGLAQAISKTESIAVRDEISQTLTHLKYNPVSEAVWQQESNWSTVKEMKTIEHPKARIIERKILDGKKVKFSAAVVEWTDYLKQLLNLTDVRKSDIRVSA